VFMNLLMNSVDAIAERGTVSLRTSFDAAACAIHVSIADTGKGMGTAEMERIFQPFFTTKPGGTGLGLPISKRLIEEQGGRMFVESSIGKGTTFTLTIPCNHGKESPREEDPCC
jgi:signal transduction histidine kinase